MCMSKEEKMLDDDKALVRRLFDDVSSAETSLPQKRLARPGHGGLHTRGSSASCFRRTKTPGLAEVSVWAVLGSNQ